MLLPNRAIKIILIVAFSGAVFFSGMAVVRLVNYSFPNESLNVPAPSNVTVTPSATGGNNVNTSSWVVMVSPIRQLYDVSLYFLPITWGVFFGILIWKGKIRKNWESNGYDYDVFKLVAKMRGSPVRIKILNSAKVPKNKLQLSKELDMNWKTIDNHVNLLLKNKLLEEMAIIGTATYYIISENGKKVLTLLSDNKD
jgi:hypothetical protein